MLALALLIFLDFRLGSVTRGYPYKILKHHCSCTSRSTFFAERVVNVWNSLPCDTVDFSSLSAFKRRLPLNELIFPGFSVFLSFYDYVYLILYGMRLLSMSTVAAPGS